MKSASVINHAEDAPGAVQAAQIALVAMGIAKVSTWSAFVADESARTKVLLTPAQQSVLERYSAVLPQISRRGAGQVTRTVVGCTHCDLFSFVEGSAPAGTRCQLTWHCPGTPVKAKSTQQSSRKNRDEEAA